MPLAFTIKPEQAQEAMRQLMHVPDVRHVAVIDAIGLCLAHVGHEPVSNMLLSDWTVVARAAFAACDQLGQRSGAGPCEESLQQHKEGGTLLRQVAGGMLLVVQHGPRCAVEELRRVALEVAQTLPTAVDLKSPPPAARASRDPFEGDAWWSEKKAAPALASPVQPHAQHRVVAPVQDAEIVLPVRQPDQPVA